MHLYLASTSSFSDFKLDKINKLVDSSLSVTDCYCITADDDYSQQHLTKLLNNAVLLSSTDIINKTDGKYIFIGPRVGTRSSWSSKATELAHNAGLVSINTVEKLKFVTWQQHDFNTKQLLDSRELYDPLLETSYQNEDELKSIFNIYDNQDCQLDGQRHKRFADFTSYDLSIDNAYQILSNLNNNLSLSLSDQELDYLITYCQQAEHHITDVELMMFAQANSEHCRHKIFNANWKIDGQEQQHSLFKMIKNTHQQNPNNTLKAYNDNGAIINNFNSRNIWPDQNNYYQLHDLCSHTVIKVETHNHPTAISPYPGAATGSGGEIRDEAATGRGGQSKAGLTGFTVSSLNILEDRNNWEVELKPAHGMQSAQDIMLEAPLGAARFNNEFGRPAICGYFRDFLVDYAPGKYLGYHKPIMLAGGLGYITNENIYKCDFEHDSLVIVLGGPALLIGLGGGAASSISADVRTSKLDFASVQRENPEMQRRCQQVINSCWQTEPNPILSIHDVGAGGLSNAVPEIVNDSNCGAVLDLARIPTDDYTMTAMELWSNEAQERYILVIDSNSLEKFNKICQRENCPYAVLGRATKSKDNKLILSSMKNNDGPTCAINLPLSVLFDNTPKMVKSVDTKVVKEYYQQHHYQYTNKEAATGLDVENLCLAVLKHPTVASKQFLITIGDRSVGGLVARDQMVGRFQVPLANCGVTLTDFTQLTGEAMAVGERSPLAAINPTAAARVAVAEAITNLLSANITKLEDVKLSANWMVASGEQVEDLALFESVQALGLDFCPALGLAIPVGKDSMSMRTRWHDNNNHSIEVKSPVSCIISAFGPVNNVNKTLTPVIINKSDSKIWMIDLANYNCEQLLAGSIQSQVESRFFAIEDNETIDIAAQLFKNLVNCILELKREGLILAYHDRSDGGLWACLSEMAIASQTGINISLDSYSSIFSKDSNEIFKKILFNEAVGVAVQVDNENIDIFNNTLDKYGLLDNTYQVAEINNNKKINIKYNNAQLSFELKDIIRTWQHSSYQMQLLRDNSKCVQQEYSSIKTSELNLYYDFEIKSLVKKNENIKPKVAILREQGSNGQIEMAAAFMRAGFECADVHLNDIIFDNMTLDDFDLLAVCGGFSYGDVLGAGRGWAARILYNTKANKVFADFFNRTDTLTLGVCNGCQMLSALKELIPGAEHFPGFINNESEQFEARLSAVKINQSKSVLLQGMAGSILPVVVSHGEGRILDNNILNKQDTISLQFVDSNQVETIAYPENPNGSVAGITGLCSDDGRVTIMMPHPERVFRSCQLSWCPESWLQEDDSPWMRLFYNAYDYFISNKIIS